MVSTNFACIGICTTFVIGQYGWIYTSSYERSKRYSYAKVHLDTKRRRSLISSWESDQTEYPTSQYIDVQYCWFLGFRSQDKHCYATRSQQACVWWLRPRSTVPGDEQGWEYRVPRLAKCITENITSGIRLALLPLLRAKVSRWSCLMPYDLRTQTEHIDGMQSDEHHFA